MNIFEIQLPLCERFPNTTQHKEGQALIYSTEGRNVKHLLLGFFSLHFLPLPLPSMQLPLIVHLFSVVSPQLVSDFFLRTRWTPHPLPPAAVHQPVPGSTKEVFPGPLAALRRWARPQEPQTPRAESHWRLLHPPARLFPSGYFTDHPSPPPAHGTTNSHKQRRASLPPSAPSQSNTAQAANKSCYRGLHTLAPAAPNRPDRRHPLREAPRSRERRLRPPLRRRPLSTGQRRQPRSDPPGQRTAPRRGRGSRGRDPRGVRSEKREGAERSRVPPPTSQQRRRPAAIPLPAPAARLQAARSPLVAPLSQRRRRHRAPTSGPGPHRWSAAGAGRGAGLRCKEMGGARPDTASPAPLWMAAGSRALRTNAPASHSVAPSQRVPPQIVWSHLLRRLRTLSSKQYKTPD